MKDICKSFPGVKALDHVQFELRSGEVMALLGENGAGKSTLMKILSGVYTRDSGSLEIFGKEYGDLTPKQAQEAGVAIIHQELNMCKHLSVAENMFLGREKTKGIVLANGDMEAEASRILNDLKIDIDPKQVVGELPVSKQQMVEIAKALSVNARILIMDEPTSALTAKEIDDLFRIIKDLAIQGMRYCIHIPQTGRASAYCRPCDHHERRTVYYFHEFQRYHDGPDYSQYGRTRDQGTVPERVV